MSQITFKDLLDLQEEATNRQVPEELDKVFKQHNEARYYYFLYLLTKKYSPRTVVELGTHWGVSAVALARGNPNNIVHTVDICTYDVHLHNDANIKSYIGSSVSSKIVSALPNDIDVLFLDSAKTGDVASLEYSLYLPKMKRGGIMLFDDILAKTEGVYRFWRELKISKLLLKKLHPGQGFGAVIVGGVGGPSPEPLKVFCLGAWDLFHIGHLNLIKTAYDLSDHGRVDVGIVGSLAIKQKKGNNRPITTFYDRKAIIDSLWYVHATVDLEDFVIPKDIIESHDIIVVGEDQTHIKNLNEIPRDKLRVLPRTKDVSTSEIVKRIKSDTRIE